MKSEAGTLALLALAISLIADLPAQGAPTQTKINKCPYVITVPGAYLVQKNLSCVVTAITINASNVDLDLGGHTLSGSGTGDGVSVQGQSSVSIHDGAVQGFVIGVELQRTLNSKITNVTASQNRDSGIAGRGSTSGLTVMGCTANQNRNHGILFDSDSRASTVTSNTTDNNGIIGILLCCGAFGISVTGNSVTQNGAAGISLDGAVSNSVADNTVTQNGDRGINIPNSNGNTVARNTSDRNGNSGIDLSGLSQGNTVEHNACTGNADGGIRLIQEGAPTGPTQNTIQDNTVSNSFHGIRLASATASQNTVQGNTATLNTLGIWVEAGATGNTLQGNTALYNTPWDLGDENPNCDSNIWSDNQFNTANQPCVAGLPPPPPPP